MSRIDTTVILGFAGVGLAVHLFPDATWKILGATLLVIVVAIIVSVNRDESRRNAQLKAGYEKGEIDREAYIAQVGEKYFRKHHGPD